MTRFHAIAGQIWDFTIPTAQRELTLAEAEALAETWNAQRDAFGRDGEIARARVMSRDIWELSLAVERAKGWRRAANPGRDPHEADARKVTA